MEEQRATIDWAVPNFVNVCIDEQKDGELSGRFYHCYDKEPVTFEHFVGMFTQMDEFFEMINYPQAEVYDRSIFQEKKSVSPKKKMLPVWQNRELGEERGKYATFFVMVKGRAHASWQGEVVWVEQGVRKTFRSERELLILMDQAVN